MVLAHATGFDRHPPLISEREDPTMFQCAAFHDERRRSRSGGLRIGEASRSDAIIPRASDPGGGPLRRPQAGRVVRLVEPGKWGRIRATDRGEQGPGRGSRQLSWRRRAVRAAANGQDSGYRAAFLRAAFLPRVFLVAAFLRDAFLVAVFFRLAMT